MKKIKIEITEDEMIKYYANKIVGDGIKYSYEFSNTIDIVNYGDIGKYKDEILKRMYRDERVADVELDSDGNFDIVFYTDYCLHYCDLDLIDDEEKREVIKNIIKLKLNEGEFLSNNMDGIDVYVTPNNYKKLKGTIIKTIEIEEEEEIE